jgi:hypothetical protein
MPPEAYTAGADMIKGVQSEIQLAGLALTGAFVLIGLWIMKLSRESKALVAEKEKAEIERTEHRKKERDSEINGITARFDAEIKEVREKFMEHMETHKVLDSRLYDRLDKIDNNTNMMNLQLAEIKIRMEMTETEKMRNLNNNINYKGKVD